MTDFYDLPKPERDKIIEYIRTHHNNPSSRYFGFWIELFRNVQLGD